MSDTMSGLYFRCLSATWATSIIGTYACGTIVGLVFSGRRLIHRVQPK